MNKSELGRLLGDLAQPMGYRRRGDLLWKRREELTSLIHLQRDPWSNGTYINLGATPNCMITKPVPPGTGYWGLERRAESMESPFRDHFGELILNRNSELSHDITTDGLRWLLQWIEENLSNAEAVRRAVLEMDPNSCVCRLGVVMLMMRDWADDRLKEPKHYFEGTAYYR